MDSKGEFHFVSLTTLVFELDADSTAVCLRIKPDRRQRIVAMAPALERRQSTESGKKKRPVSYETSLDK